MIEIGHIAPLFSLPNQDNIAIACPTKGQKFILFFYPKDMTPGCTAEACSLQDGIESLLSMGYHVIGISPDSVASHKKFAEKYHLNYNLLSDSDKVVVNQYGVWGQKKFMGKEYMGVFRTTFVVNELGIITHRIDKIDTKKAAVQLIELLK